MSVYMGMSSLTSSFQIPLHFQGRKAKAVAQQDYRLLYLRQRAGAAAERTHKLAGNVKSNLTNSIQNLSC